MDPYRLLGVSPGCTLEEVKRAYRAQVRLAHPDLGGNESAFIAVCAAYRRVLEELARRPASRGAAPAFSQSKDSSLHPSSRVTQPKRGSTRQKEEASRASRPADPLWDPELILVDQPVWVGHPGRPADPDWQPELILLDAEQKGAGASVPERAAPRPSGDSVARRGTAPARAARRRRELSSRELMLAIVILLGMMVIVVGAFLQIVWRGGTSPGP